MHREPILVPKIAFLTAWEWEGHGRPPAVIGMKEFWLADEARRQLEDKVLAVLTDLGLASGGTLTKDFREALAVLAGGSQHFTAWLGDVGTGDTGGILVSTYEYEAARLLREDTMIRIDPIPPERAAESLVDALPDVAPARIEPVAVPKSGYSPHLQARSEEFSFDMPTSYEGRDPVQRMRELMAGKRSGSHQLYAATAGDRSTPLTVIDIVGEGRVLTFVSDAPGEEPKIHCLPGTRQNLVHTLYSTRSGLR